jgi:hypothetical protein
VVRVKHQPANREKVTLLILRGSSVEIFLLGFGDYRRRLADSLPGAPIGRASQIAKKHRQSASSPMPSPNSRTKHIRQNPDILSDIRVRVMTIDAFLGAIVLS